MPKELIQARNTRTGDARKIDEWTINLPGGEKAKFDLAMRYVDQSSLFILTSDHPSFKGIRMQDTDLGQLRADLQDMLEEYIQTDLSEDWSPACQLEIRHRMSDDRAEDRDLRFSLSINLRDVEIHDKQALGNIPIATIRDAYSTHQTVIRSHSDDFAALKPKSGSLLDPEVKAWMAHPVSRDEETGAGRIIERGDGSPQLELVKALNAFSEHLSARLSPERVDIEGFPNPEELVGLMEMATSLQNDIDEGFEP